MFVLGYEHMSFRRIEITSNGIQAEAAAFVIGFKGGGVAAGTKEGQVHSRDGRTDKQLNEWGSIERIDRMPIWVTNGCLSTLENKKLDQGFCAPFQKPNTPVGQPRPIFEQGGFSILAPLLSGIKSESQKARKKERKKQSPFANRIEDGS
ncbi:hypothetical protein TWF751_009649 [Orbilia oligospora]|nr:hypothetical protein TWF751_009649 [Orbilia oligospora]